MNHDVAFGKAGDVSLFSPKKAMANRTLANSLRASFRTQPLLGPTAEVYRAGEFLLFDALARLGGK